MIIQDLWVRFTSDKIYKKFKFEPAPRGKINAFITNATVEDIVKNFKAFMYLCVEQNALIITENGLPDLDGKFIVSEVWISVSGLLFICKVKSNIKLTHRRKNLAKLRKSLSSKYSIECEVDLED